MIFSDSIYKTLIETALTTLFDKDGRIISRKLKEEAINHRLAVYLENGIKNYDDLCNLNIDIEYNKNYDEKKAIIGINGQKYYIRPDILIHKREDNYNNKVAIECKIETLSKKDRRNLIALKKEPYNYDNCFGIVYKPDKDYFFFYYVKDNKISKKIQVSKKNVDI